MEKRCKLWLPKKKRFCANCPLNDSPFCGNHTVRPDGKWVPCPVDPSHNVLEENLKGHVKRCPLVKLANTLSLQPFYQKAINAGGNKEDEEDIIITSQMKRDAVYSLTSADASRLINKIKSVHASICKDIQDSYKIPEACSVWINRQVDQKLPFQEKHVRQQASILGNLEEIGAFKNDSSCRQEEPAVVEFGAGRGYLTQMLADCYGIKKVYLVERKSYKLKADRSLRQIDSMILERLRIDIEDLNLDGVEALKGTPYLAIGKHLCGPATDMTLRCCLLSRGDEKQVIGHCYPRGVAIATCCHYLCQWKHYISKSYMKSLGISKDEFNAITWFTSWAVDADHSSDLPDGVDSGLELEIMCSREYCSSGGAEVVFGEMTPTERAILGFLCKDIIDMGRLMWVKERVSEARLVKYVPSNISPENRLLIAIDTKLNE
ncbi:tRNA:m(4)X modification enzyme TRM13 homolog [Impatiens glandulifera]|uniref:tRNA:m(4)X modification enzyme TRM13 homolog n=1 Tax=Impatiens glandulifera TaxID=253017 RepID=UPI001FB06ACF|nr:tRNA:m(4)X modification enzyme TRM13 homolog [Impatiens glandulifera]